MGKTEIWAIMKAISFLNALKLSAASKVHWRRFKLMQFVFINYCPCTKHITQERLIVPVARQEENKIKIKMGHSALY